MSEPMAKLLGAFERAGVLSSLDVHLATTLCRIGGESRPEVALAAALSSRAPRYGHICAELDRAAETIEAEGADGALSWPPDRQEWIASLAGSPLLRAEDDEEPTPLVLDGPRLYLDRYWRYQQRLLGELRQRATHTRSDVDAELLAEGLERLFVSDEDDELDRQRLAALMAVLRGLTVISGGPGTGKTTTVKKVLALLLEQRFASAEPGPGLRILLAAPTAKAASRLGESLGHDLDKLDTTAEVRAALGGLEASTIHRMLGARMGAPTSFRYHGGEPLPAEVVVVDEASMVDFALMTRLVEAVPEGARLILLGDRDQLASVEAGSVLGDVCGAADAGLRFSKTFVGEVAGATGLDLSAHAEVEETEGIWDCMVRLTRVYRFEEGSGIAALARAINAGAKGADDALAFLRHTATLPGAEEEAYEDLALHEVEPASGRVPAAALAAMVEGYGPLLDAVEGGDVEGALDALGEHRVLCAHRRGPLGVEGIGRAIERRLEATRPGFSAARQTWYEGRPILVRQNDYTLRLFNGDAGVIVRDPEEPSRLTAAFRRTDGSTRLVSPARLPAHVTVFATTVHQSQGSQLRHAVVVLPDRPSPILTRELVYTAVTRAREHVTVVAPEEVLRRALAVRVQRASGLPARLWGE